MAYSTGLARLLIARARLRVEAARLGMAPSALELVVRAREAARGHHAPGEPYRYKHGWIPVAGMPELLHDDEDTIRATFNYHDEETGLTATVESIGPALAADPPPTFVQVKIRDANGKEVGKATRFIGTEGDKTTVDHGLFELDRGVRGQGFATRYNAHVEAGYRAHGIQRITLHADIDVGGYSWARSGYDFHSAEDRQGVRRRAVRMGKRMDSSIQEQIQRVAANPAATPIEYAMIGYTPGAKMWPGKEIMLGSKWVGVKTL